LDDENMPPIASLIEKTETIKELRLVSNRIKDKGSCLLGKALTQNSSISVLDLKDNCLKSFRFFFHGPRPE